jgi:hypothetical protein
MIGSVSTGFRRRRRRNASRAAVAATARPAGSRQLPPADPRDVRAIPAPRESTVVSSTDRCARTACPSKPSPAEPRARRNFTLASGVAAATIARERARTSAGFAGVLDSGAATSGATRELAGRSVVAWPLAIVGWIAASSGGDAAGLSAVLRSELPLGSLAGDGPAVAAGAASRVSRGTATTAGSAAGEGAGASREGSTVSGSTYPCGSLVARVPK